MNQTEQQFGNVLGSIENQMTTTTVASKSTNAGWRKYNNNNSNGNNYKRNPNKQHAQTIASTGLINCNHLEESMASSAVLKQNYSGAAMMSNRNYNQQQPLRPISSYPTEANRMNPAIKNFQEELREVKAQLSKYENEALKEKFKVNNCNLSLERHSINLYEWDSLLKSKMNESAQFVHSFRMNVYYSNETQLNKLLFKNRYFSDLTSEIFELQDKYSYIIGLMRQLQTIKADLLSKIEELNQFQEPLKIRQSQLEHLLKRELKQ